MLLAADRPSHAVRCTAVNCYGDFPYRITCAQLSRPLSVVRGPYIKRTIHRWRVKGNGIEDRSEGIEHSTPDTGGGGGEGGGGEGGGGGMGVQRRSQTPFDLFFVLQIEV